MGLLPCFEKKNPSKKILQIQIPTGPLLRSWKHHWNHQISNHGACGIAWAITFKTSSKSTFFFGGGKVQKRHIPVWWKVHGQENFWVKIFHIFITQKLLGPKIIWVSRFPTKKLTISGISGDKILRHTDMTVKCLAFDDRGLTQYWNKHVWLAKISCKKSLCDTSLWVAAAQNVKHVSSLPWPWEYMIGSTKYTKPWW